jgi:hypothetical protein
MHETKADDTKPPVTNVPDLKSKSSRQLPQTGDNCVWERDLVTKVTVTT